MTDEKVTVKITNEETKVKYKGNGDEATTMAVLLEGITQEARTRELPAKDYASLLAVYMVKYAKERDEKLDWDQIQFNGEMVHAIGDLFTGLLANGDVKDTPEAVQDFIEKLGAEANAD